MIRLFDRDPSGVDSELAWAGGLSASVDYGAIELASSGLSLGLGRRIVGRLAGSFAGIGAGTSLDPRDLRDYTVGDDVRHIDWNATARTGQPQVRTFEADRELCTTVAVDMSPSMYLGSGRCDKRSVTVGAAATLGLALCDGVSRLGAVAFDGRSSHMMADRPGAAHVRDVIGAIDRLEPARSQLSAGFSTALSLAARQGRGGRLVIVISDFLDGAFAQPLRELAVDNMVSVVEIVDRLDTELPNVGPISFVDPETGRSHRVNTASRSIREAYTDAALEQRAERLDLFAALGVGHLALHTDGDWLTELSGILLDDERIGGAE